MAASAVTTITRNQPRAGLVTTVVRLGPRAGTVTTVVQLARVSRAGIVTTVAQFPDPATGTAGSWFLLFFP